MTLTHAKQRVATRPLKRSRETWLVEVNERSVIEMQIASGEARSAWRWNTDLSMWEFVVWLPHAVPPALLKAQQERMARYQAVEASPAAPKPQVVPLPPPVAEAPERRVQIVRLPPAQPVGGKTLVPHMHDPARW